MARYKRRVFNHTVKIIDGKNYWNTAKLESYLGLNYNNLNVEHTYYKKTGSSKYKTIFDNRMTIKHNVWYPLDAIKAYEQEQQDNHQTIWDAIEFLDGLINEHGVSHVSRLYGVTRRRIHQWRKFTFQERVANRILALKETQC